MCETLLCQIKPVSTFTLSSFSLNTSFFTQVEFSDESDPEADPKAELKAKAEVSKKRTTTRSRRAPETPVQQAPVKTPRRKKSTAVAPSVSSEDEAAAAAGPVRRGRGRRPLAGSSETGKGEEPEKMRTIDEELDGAVLDLSIEQLRASDTEDDAAASRDLFVLPHLFVAGLIRICFVFN